MRRGFIFLLIILLAGGLATLAAQSPVTQVQYYWNAGDWSGGQTIGLTPGTDVSQAVQFNASALPPGLNYLHYRVRNGSGNWGLPQHRLFLKTTNQPLSPVTAAEYFWDSDPGLGNAIPADLSDGLDVQQLAGLTVPAMADGLHHFSLRVRNVDGEWSIALHRVYFKTGADSGLSPVTAAEYFFDTDPGLGNAIALDLVDGLDVQQMVQMALSEASIGFHHTGIRVRNDEGKWSQTFWQLLFKPGYPEIADIASITWYFTGPGVSESTTYEMPGVTPGQDVQTSEPLLLTHLAQGQTYFVHIQAVSTLGKKSQETVVKFTVNWIPDPQASTDGTNCLLSWAGIPGATSYQVLAASNPAEAFTLIGSTSNTFWPDPILNKRFFRVKAIRQ